MNKFEKTISDTGNILTQRGKNLSDTVVLEVEELTFRIKKEKALLENKIVNLTDIAPDNTYSLRPGGPDFNATEWVKELFDTKLKLSMVDVKLDVVKNIKKEWFTTLEDKK